MTKTRVNHVIILLTLTIIFFSIVSFIATVHAQDPWVETYDINDNPTTVFDKGDTVRIKAFCETTPYDIIVKDPTGTTVWSDTSATQYYSKDVDGITTTLGWWHIMAGSAHVPYAIAWYHVIPEVPFGILAVIGACFASLVITNIRRKQ